MVMHGCVLILTDNEDLLRVRLAGIRRKLVMPVANGEDHQADVSEIPGSEVGDVPAELATPYLIALATLCFPVLDTPVRKCWQSNLVPIEKRDRIRDEPVDFGSFHIPSSPQVDRQRVPLLDDARIAAVDGYLRSRSPRECLATQLGGELCYVLAGDFSFENVVGLVFLDAHLVGGRSRGKHFRSPDAGIEHSIRMQRIDSNPVFAPFQSCDTCELLQSRL